MINYSVFDDKIFSRGDLDQKIIIFKLSWNLVLRIWRMHWWCSFFLLLTTKLFLENTWSKNHKISYLDYFESAELNGDVHFFLFSTANTRFCKNLPLNSQNQRWKFSILYQKHVVGSKLLIHNNDIGETEGGPNRVIFNFLEKKI